jgi:hypothetical protein
VTGGRSDFRKIVVIGLEPPILDAHGVFILAGAGVPPLGPLNGAHLLDVAPTLLELGGYDVPSTMRDRTPFSGLASRAAEAMAYPEDGESSVRERLSGLGYTIADPVLPSLRYDG